MFSKQTSKKELFFCRSFLQKRPKPFKASKLIKEAHCDDLLKSICVAGNNIFRNQQNSFMSSGLHLPHKTFHTCPIKYFCVVIWDTDPRRHAIIQMRHCISNSQGKH